jgi:hypothetical protein
MYNVSLDHIHSCSNQKALPSILKGSKLDATVVSFVVNTAVLEAILVSR